MRETHLTGLAGSFLGDIDSDARDELLSDAVLLDIERGASVYSPENGRHIGILLEGVARSFLTGPDGRQLTLRYARPRTVLTTAVSGAANNPMPVGSQAVTRVSVIDLSFDRLLDLQRTNTSIVRALAAESTRRLADVYRTFAATFFGSVRERLAAHLLDTAEQLQHLGGLVAPVTQQDLAVALGTAREVVGRALQQFQAEGLVEVRRGGVVITNARGLVTAAGTWWVPSRQFAVDGATAYESFDGSPQPVVAIDGSGDIVYANAAVERTFGWRPRDLVGKPVTTLMPSTVRPGFQQRREAFTDDLGPGPIGLAGNFHGRRADGSEFPVEISILPVRRTTSMIVFATMVDVSYRQALRERLERRQSGAPSSPMPEPAGALSS